MNYPENRIQSDLPMTYEKALSYIHSVSWKGSVPGLSRITELCRRLGDVQRGLRFVHVAGTNGKGSTSAMIASVLRAAGYRVGLFTSPYIVDFCERIMIDGEPISREALCRATERVKPHADAMKDAPTEFELITAIGFVCFAEAKCNVVVLECGMGGRLDSTNVIDGAEVSVITNIALDHTEYLGDTVEKIAAEKAGIIKGTSGVPDKAGGGASGVPGKAEGGAPCVLGKADAGAAAVIAARCAECGVPLVRATRAVRLTHVRPSREGIAFRRGKAELFIPLCGLYQITNVHTALAALDVMRRGGWDISPEALADGLRSVRWRGRFETLSTDPTVIFDGAHNPDGAALCAATFSRLYGGERSIFVSGVMADKDRDSIASIFAPLFEKAYTAAPDNPRALDAATWADELRAAGCDAVPCASVAEAVTKAVAEARRTGATVLCAGSLYMYGEVAAALDEATGEGADEGTGE